MDKSTFELRQAWATENLKRCNQSINEDNIKIEELKYKVTATKQEKLRYEKILNLQQ
jgi:hypothetical protein